MISAFRSSRASIALRLREDIAWAILMVHCKLTGMLCKSSWHKISQRRVPQERSLARLDGSLGRRKLSLSNNVFARAPCTILQAALTTPASMSAYGPSFLQLPRKASPHRLGGVTQYLPRLTPRPAPRTGQFNPEISNPSVFNSGFRQA